MPQTFCCKRCNKTSTNIKRFFNHLNRHRRTKYRKKYYNFSPQVLQIYIDTDYHFEFDEEDRVIDFGYEGNDDFGVLCMEVFDIENEVFALEVLNKMDFTRCDSIGLMMTDDRDKLREYLLDLGIIDKIDCDICEVHENYSFEEWEELDKVAEKIKSCERFTLHVNGKAI